jgi:hypothetical protein
MITSTDKTSGKIWSYREDKVLIYLFAFKGVVAGAEEGGGGWQKKDQQSCFPQPTPLLAKFHTRFVHVK